VKDISFYIAEVIKKGIPLLCCKKPLLESLNLLLCVGNWSHKYGILHQADYASHTQYIQSEPEKV
jgi:hypothetical protein